MLRYGFVLVCFSSLLACSYESLFDSMQSEARRDCYRMPKSEQQACLEQQNQVYDDYKKQRNEAVKK